MSESEPLSTPLSRPLAPPRFRRSGPLLLAAIAVALFYFLAPSWPHEQRVHAGLGDLAPRVTSVEFDYLAGTDNRAATGDSEAAHGASFHYAAGQAPRIVEHAPSLPNGSYRVELVIELTNPPDRIDVKRNVTLDEHTVTLPIEATSK